MYGLTENQINILNSIFEQYPNIEQVILYGSRAKENYRSGSDIDLTVKGEYISIDLLNVIKTQINNSILPYLVDLSNYKELSNSELIEHIDRVGIVFYQRKKGAEIYPDNVVSRLEDARNKLYLSIMHDDKTTMRSAMQYVADNLPFVVSEAKNITRQLKNNKHEYQLIEFPISSLPYRDVCDNLAGYLFAIDNFIKVVYPKTLSFKTYGLLFNHQDPFLSTDILHERNGDRLAVSDLLKVVGYAEKVINTIDPALENKEFYNVLIVFKSIDAALNNKPYEKPTNKLLHLANDALTGVVKKNAKDDDSKRMMNGISLLVDLAIDLFIKK